MTASAQSASAPPLPSPAELWRVLRTPAPALIAGIALLGVVFGREAASAYQVWMDSTAYSHCFFVLPIALYLAWERRGHIVATPIVALPMASALVAPLGLAWLAAERLGIMEGRQLVAISILEVLFLAVLGWRMAFTLAAPLLYLYFLVPFGAFLTPILQHWTAAFSIFGLEFLEIPFYADQYLIEIPEGHFYVAEACAGLRFLIASIAFGALYACLMYRTAGRRIAFIVASIVIPIVANWFRALGIVVLGHILGSAQAAAADHILYGWLFFSIVTLLLIVAGLPFRQDPEPAPIAATTPPPAGKMLPAMVVAVALASIGPGISLGLDRAALMQLDQPRFAWTIPLGCTASQPEAAAQGVERVNFICPQAPLIATAQVFPDRVNPAAVGAARRLVSGEADADDVTNGTLEIPGTNQAPWRLTIAGSPTGTTASASILMVDGAPARGGFAGRFAMARNSIFGSPHKPLLLSVSMRLPRPQITGEEERLIKLFLGTFLAVQSNLETEARRLAGG